MDAGLTDYTELILGPLPRVRVQVASTPMPSLISVLSGALGGPDQGVPAELSRQVRGLLAPRAIGAIEPVFARAGHTELPDCLTPIDPDNLDFDRQLSQLRELRPDDFVAGLDALGGAQPPPVWRSAIAQPRRWLELYVDSLSVTWQAFAPIWRRSAGLRARETERIGVAVVSNALDALLASISTRSQFSANSLFLPDRAPYQVTLNDRRVILMPLTSGPTASVFNLDEPDQVWIGYPLAADRSASRQVDGLNLLVGPQRGAILRALSHPTTMGRLARKVNAKPSTLTYSCRQLETADLITRERVGREVRIVRTARGDALLDLLSRPHL
jgi:DNA-binding transcriptional ArsR family regulator